VTKLFRVRFPIVLPGMSWVSNPKLVASVSNAGGLGILATGPLSARQTKESIDEIRRYQTYAHAGRTHINGV
jgi:enoyl-[acyl-carrier protein] reductase II